MQISVPFSECGANYLILVYFSPRTSVGVSAILLGLVLVGRAAFVFPLSFLSNLTKKSSYEKIDIKQQVLLSRYSSF